MENVESASSIYANEHAGSRLLNLQHIL